MLSASVLVIGFGIAGPQTPAPKAAETSVPTKATKAITHDEAREIWDRLVNTPALEGKEEKDGSKLLLLTEVAAPQIFESEDAALTFVQYESVCREFILRVEQYRVGRGDLQALLNCAQRRFQSQIKVSKSNADRVRFCDEFESVMAQLYRLQKARFEAGGLTDQDLQQTGCALAEIHLQAMKIRIER
jgi:hypothetical protein